MSDGAIRTTEHELVQLIKEWTDSARIGDDCAILPSQGLASCDTLVEGTHFLLSTTTLCDLGWKCVAVNLSDIAAMAGRPRHLLVSITVPGSFSLPSFKELYQGMQNCAIAYKAAIVGGDLTFGASLSITVTALGDVHENGCLTRNGARAGDLVATTGDFGASAAGLWLLGQGEQGLKKDSYHHCLEAHRRPLPRLCESWALVRKCGNRGALMDSSDGLADCLVQISQASKVGMQIDLDAIPVHSETKEVAALAGKDSLDWALYGGEDYELVCCLPEVAFAKLSEDRDNPFTIIGRVTGEAGVELRSSGKPSLELDLSRSFQQIKF